MNPCELSVLVSAIANGLYGCLSPLELEVAAAVFVQLGDTLAAMSAQRALLEAGGCKGEAGAG